MLKIMEVSFKFDGVWLGRKHRYIPHSLNHPLHWRQRAAWTSEWKQRVFMEILPLKKQLGKLPLDHPTITIIFHSCNKMDRDNAWSASKPITDGLRYAGVLQDDRSEDFEQGVRVEKAGKRAEQGVEVIIEF